MAEDQDQLSGGERGLTKPKNASILVLVSLAIGRVIFYVASIIWGRQGPPVFIGGVAPGLSFRQRHYHRLYHHNHHKDYHHHHNVTIIIMHHHHDLCHISILCGTFFFDSYYKDDNDVARDYELQDFANELSIDGKGEEGGYGMVRSNK